MKKDKDLIRTARALTESRKKYEQRIAELEAAICELLCCGHFDFDIDTAIGIRALSEETRKKEGYKLNGVANE